MDDTKSPTGRMQNLQPEMQSRVLKGRSVGKTDVAVIGHSFGKFAAAAAVATVAAGGFAKAIGGPLTKQIKEALGPDKTKSPPQEADVDTPFATKIGVKLDGVVRPNDVLSYNVAEGWVECGRYTTINGNRVWRRERGRILSYRKTGLVEPFWR